MSAALAGSARGRPRAFVFVDSCKSYLPAGGQAAQRSAGGGLFRETGRAFSQGLPGHLHISTWRPAAGFLVFEVRGLGEWGQPARRTPPHVPAPSSRPQRVQACAPDTCRLTCHRRASRGPAWSQRPYPSGLFQGKDSLLGDSAQRVVSARATPPPAFLQPPGSTGSLASYTLLCSSRMSHAAPTRWPATECPERLVGGPASQFSRVEQSWCCVRGSGPQKKTPGCSLTDRHARTPPPGTLARTPSPPPAGPVQMCPQHSKLLGLGAPQGPVNDSPTRLPGGPGVDRPPQLRLPPAPTCPSSLGAMPAPH